AGKKTKNGSGAPHSAASTFTSLARTSNKPTLAPGGSLRDTPGVGRAASNRRTRPPTHARLFATATPGVDLPSFGGAAGNTRPLPPLTDLWRSAAILIARIDAAKRESGESITAQNRL